MHFRWKYFLIDCWGKIPINTYLPSLRRVSNEVSFFRLPRHQPAADSSQRLTTFFLPSGSWLLSSIFLFPFLLPFQLFPCIKKGPSLSEQPLLVFKNFSIIANHMINPFSDLNELATSTFFLVPPATSSFTRILLAIVRATSS